MPLIGAIIGDELVRFKDIPHTLLPPEILKGMDDGPRGGVHMTELTICPHKVSMQKKKNYYLPLDIIYRMARGKAWDAFAQLHPRDGGVYQKTFSRNFLGVDIVGTPDVMVYKEGLIEDYKSPARMYTYPPIGYTMQLNGYRYLSEEVFSNEYGKAADTLRILAVGPGGYKRFPVDVWDMEDIYDEMAIALTVLQGVLDKEPHLCADPNCIYCRSKAVYED